MTTPHPMTAQLPPAIIDCANAHQLGAHRTTFLPKRIGAARMTILFLYGVVFTVLLIGLYFFYLAFTTPNLSRKQAAKRLHLFEHGMLVADENGPVEVFRWDSVVVYQEIVRQNAYGVHVNTFYTYRMVRPDGSIVKITQFYDQPDEWGSMIQESIVQAQFPTTVIALDGGQDRNFGPFTVSATGISTSRRSLTWPEVSEYSLYNGQIMISKVGKRLPAMSAEIKKVPNVFVLTSVLDRFTAA